MGIQRRCHVSSVYPAARVFAFGSTCMRRGRGEYNLRLLFGPKSSTATVSREDERGSLQYNRNLRRNFPLGKMQAPGEDEAGWERERALRLIYFQQSGKCLAAHCPAPGALGRYTP